ncbi:MAG: hypothetical protein J5586_01720 [Clostridia bacterium]|nr:hypothetical protein [Clostridia bacterium]
MDEFTAKTLDEYKEQVTSYLKETFPTSTLASERLKQVSEKEWRRYFGLKYSPQYVGEGLMLDLI